MPLQGTPFTCVEPGATGTEKHVKAAVFGSEPRFDGVVRPRMPPVRSCRPPAHAARPLMPPADGATLQHPAHSMRRTKHDAKQSMQRAKHSSSGHAASRQARLPRGRAGAAHRPPSPVPAAAASGGGGAPKRTRVYIPGCRVQVISHSGLNCHSLSSISDVAAGARANSRMSNVPTKPSAELCERNACTAPRVCTPKPIATRARAAARTAELLALRS
jgi:hypothetical protein